MITKPMKNVWCFFTFIALSQLLRFATFILTSVDWIPVFTLNAKNLLSNINKSAVRSCSLLKSQNPSGSTAMLLGQSPREWCAYAD